MQFSIRNATANDAEELLAIYQPHILNNSITFETEPLTVDEFRSRIDTVLLKFPWLVTELDGKIGGYVYASEHRQRRAYQWSVETAVYMAPFAQGKGIAKSLYARLFELLREQGYFNAYAGITLPNQASVALHESMGFTPIGIYKEIGFKHGSWHDVGWWQLRLQPIVNNPASPTAPRSK